MHLQKKKKKKKLEMLSVENKLHVLNNLISKETRYMCNVAMYFKIFKRVYNYTFHLPK